MTNDRPAGLQQFIDNLKKNAGISDAFAAASNHPGTCRCIDCLDWWIAMGADPDTEKYGPFTDEEIEARKKEMG